jgi:hypothetical protein
VQAGGDDLQAATTRHLQDRQGSPPPPPIVVIIPMGYIESIHHNINREVSITATCGLVWHYQLSNKTMAFS